MPIELIEAIDPDQSKSKFTRALIDNGSQRTYIMEEIVKNVKLTTGGKVKLTFLTFGATNQSQSVLSS